MQIAIRKINKEDVDILSVIAKKSFYDTFTGTCSDEDMENFLQESFNVEQLAKELMDANNNYLIAEVDGIPAGYMLFAEDYSSFPFMKKWKALELKRLYVLNEFHKKGIAQKLMDHYIACAGRQGYNVAWLGVWENNIRAQRFYEKYGFVNSGYTHDFPIGNTPQTDIWLWKFLE